MWNFSHLVKTCIFWPPAFCERGCDGLIPHSCISIYPFPSLHTCFSLAWVQVGRESRGKEVTRKFLYNWWEGLSFLAPCSLILARVSTLLSLSRSCWWAIWMFFLLGFLFCKIFNLQKMIFSYLALIFIDHLLGSTYHFGFWTVSLVGGILR